jgi:hypothetical protein
MPPLFACSGCGVQIERSTRSYVQQKGRLLCSTCRDRLDDEGPRPAGLPGAGAAAQRREPGRSEPA